jgi:intracellular multiplication protein IcmG
MSEFSPQTAVPPPAPVMQAPSQSWLQRPIILGLSIPWIAGLVVVLIAAAAYLFMPAQTSNVNRLAFGDQEAVSDQAFTPVATPKTVALGGASFQVQPDANVTQIQDQVAAMVSGVRSYAEANRDAITKLAETVKSLSAGQAALKQQITELQAQNAILSAAHGTTPQSRPTVRTEPGRASKPTPTSPLAGMHLSAVQNGMAWVFWQDKTWAVQVGDTVGPVTVTGIDAQSRRVRTSAGVLE